MTEETKAGALTKNKEELDEDEDYLKPPDGGWGWMVVLGSFVIHVIADGVYYSFGVFLVALIENFEVGRGEAGWVGSILIGTLLSVGPIASVMTNTLGCRIVVTIGTLLTFFGFIISMWAPNIYFLYVSIGIIGGTGLGLAYLPAIVSISFYFEKKRSFATGIAVCGSGIGTFIFAPLSQILLDEYGWKGALLIEAALLLNCIAAGLLFRPLEPTRKKSRSKPVSASTTATSLPEERQKLTLDVNLSPSDNSEGKQLSPRIQALKHETPALSSSMHLLPISGEDSMSKNNRLHKSDLHLNVPNGNAASASKSHTSHPHPHTTVVRKDAFYTGSLANIPLYKEHEAEYRQSMISIHRDRSRISESAAVTAKETDAAKSSCSICSEENIAELKESMDLGLFKDVLFQLFAWSNFLTNFAFFVPYMFLPDRAMLMGINSKTASSLVSLIGLSNTIGRLIFGFLADRKFINRLMLYNTAVTVGGIVTVASALAYNFWWLGIYAVTYGLVIGVYVTLTPIMIVDLLGIEKLSNAFGLVMFFQGAATFIGPPIAGWFYDGTGSYMWPFVMFGSLLALSGIMLYPIPWIRRYLERNQGVTQHDVDMGKKVTSTEYISVSPKNSLQEENHVA